LTAIQWKRLPDSDFAVSSLCGLFHDIGRFEQAVKFGTMDDRVTGSHADISARIFLDETPHKSTDAELTDEQTEVTAAAIRYHNLCQPPLPIEAGACKAKPS